MKILIAFFSFTGYTKKVAEALFETLRPLDDVDICEVEPVKKHSVRVWLAASFIPNLKVKIKAPILDLSSYDLVCLGFPKWTFSCPPINEYVTRMAGFEEKRFLLFMTYGGFDEKRFLRGMVKKMRKKGGSVVEAVGVKRKHVQNGTYLQAVRKVALELHDTLARPSKETPIFKEEYI